MARIIKTILLLSTMLIVFNCKTYKHQKESNVEIENVKLYKHFELRGYTTAGAFTNFMNLSDNRTNYINLDKNEIKKLEEMLNNAEKKKHFQTKLGTGLIFCEVIFSNKINYPPSRVVLDINIEEVVAIDLTGNLEYIITEKFDILWFQEFIKKIKIDNCN